MAPISCLHWLWEVGWAGIQESMLYCDIACVLEVSGSSGWAYPVDTILLTTTKLSGIVSSPSMTAHKDTVMPVVSRVQEPSTSRQHAVDDAWSRHVQLRQRAELYYAYDLVYKAFTCPFNVVFATTLLNAACFLLMHLPKVRFQCPLSSHRLEVMGYKRLRLHSR